MFILALAHASQQDRPGDGKFVVMGQVQSGAGKSIHRSGSGPVGIPRVRHSPGMARQGFGDGDNLRTDWDSSPWGPRPGRAGLWGPGAQHCCSITGAGSDGPEAEMGP